MPRRVGSKPEGAAEHAWSLWSATDARHMGYGRVSWSAASAAARAWATAASESPAGQPVARKPARVRAAGHSGGMKKRPLGPARRCSLPGYSGGPVVVAGHLDMAIRLRYVAVNWLQRRAWS
jgi:hypothetical protein